MITLHTFGPAFGLPDPSPFVMKAELLLKLSGLAYETAATGLRGAPKGKLPYLRDGDRVVADSTFIRLYLEERYGIDLDRGLSDAERGVAWAVDKMCEDHLYWLMIEQRWMDDENFARGPANFFRVAPAPIRPLIKSLVRRRLRRTLHSQGLGRHSAEERTRLAERLFTSLASILGDKPYLLGTAPCSADTSVFAFVAGTLSPLFAGTPRPSAEAHPNLVAYARRLMKEYHPQFAAS
jgi:glutathione S-transferase